MPKAEHEHESNIGHVVSRIRSRLGVSQTRLAELIGTTPDYISRIEKQGWVPSWELIFKLFAVTQREEMRLLEQSAKSEAAPNRRRDNMLRALSSATAILKGFANWDQTPQEVREIIEEFLSRWEPWLDKSKQLDQLAWRAQPRYTRFSDGTLHDDSHPVELERSGSFQQNMDEKSAT